MTLVIMSHMVVGGGDGDVSCLCLSYCPCRQWPYVGRSPVVRCLELPLEIALSFLEGTLGLSRVSKFSLHIPGCRW